MLFDEFTKESIGVELMKRYQMSKGKSLSQFTKDASENQIILLMQALLKYYEESPKYYIERTTDLDYQKLYLECRKIMDKCNNISPFINAQIENTANNFSNEYIKSQLKLMIQLQKKNPTEAIGKAKELIESCCITILERSGVNIDKRWDCNRLVTETKKILHITPHDIPDDIPEAVAMKQLLQCLSTIANNIAQIRNTYGSGHGKSDSYKGLQERHAKLAVGCSETLVEFLWDSFNRQQNINQY